MPTSFTTNLRLSNHGLGDTGWGSTVSNGMIDLVDPAIAGTTTLSADTDVILTTANGMADQARQMILNCTGSRAAQRTITAPASSKVYVVINGTTGGFGVKIVGVGPTTGVVVPAGRMAVVAWNGSDFVTLGAVVDLHVAGQTRIQDSASASNYILIGSGTNAPRGGNSVMAQTGSMVMGTEAASSLFFVTNAATAMTLDASGNLGVGTTSPTGAKVVIEGSASAPSVFNALALRNSLDGSVALIFDNSTSATLASIEALITSTGAGTDDGVLAFGTALNGVNAERMRLDASGNLGLGVTPSAWGADTKAIDINTQFGVFNNTTGNGTMGLLFDGYYNAGYKYKLTGAYAGAYEYSAGIGAHAWKIAGTGTAGNAITFTQAMTLDASGNLGVGTISPSARLHVDAASSGSGLIVGYLNQTASEVNIGIGYRTAGHPFVGTNTNSNPLEIGTRSNTHTAFVTNDTERARFTAVGDFIHQVNGTAPTLSTNSTMSFELTSNTSLKVVVRGTDGVTRSVSLTLS